jgi:hypothetical protein
MPGARMAKHLLRASKNSSDHLVAFHRTTQVPTNQWRAKVIRRQLFQPQVQGDAVTVELVPFGTLASLMACVQTLSNVKKGGEFDRLLSEHAWRQASVPRAAVAASAFEGLAQHAEASGVFES